MMRKLAVATAFALLCALSAFAENKPQAKLEISTTIYASKRLISSRGADYYLRITDSSAEIFFAQTGVRLSYQKDLLPIPGELDNEFIVNPAEFALKIPREPNTLVIAFTHQYLIEPASESRPDGRLDYAINRRGWIIVGVYPGELGERYTTESTLLHELGHAFGANHSEDTSSIMCSSALSLKCSKNSTVFDDRSLWAIRGGVQEIKKRGAEKYWALREIFAGTAFPRKSNECPNCKRDYDRESFLLAGGNHRACFAVLELRRKRNIAR